MMKLVFGLRQMQTNKSPMFCGGHSGSGLGVTAPKAGSRLRRQPGGRWRARAPPIVAGGNPGGATPTPMLGVFGAVVAQPEPQAGGRRPAGLR